MRQIDKLLQTLGEPYDIRGFMVRTASTGNLETTNLRFLVRAADIVFCMYGQSHPG